MNIDKSQNVVEDLEQQLATQKAETIKLLDENNLLRDQLALLLYNMYAPKSEKFSKKDLQFDEAEITEEEKKIAEEGDEGISVAAHSRKNPIRKPLPKDLPRVTIKHELPEDQLKCSCGCLLHVIGEDRSEQLEYIPAQLKIIEHIRLKYGCRCCEEGVKYAALPKHPIPKSIATPGLLANILISKYCDALPLYRQEGMWRRLGIDLPRATLSNWALKCGELFSPLIPLMQQEIISGKKSNADETPVQVMNEPGKKNTSKSYMWIFVGGSKSNVVVFKYHATRGGVVATEFYEGFKGYLQADDYSGYNTICREKDVIRLGCWMHARRKFADIVKVAKKAGKAHVAIGYIKKLYKIEKLAKEQKLSAEQIKELRTNEAKPVLDEFKQWLQDTQGRTPPKGLLGKAIAYSLSNWPELTVYLNDGELEIDNGVAERALKPFVIGRKNWLFMGSVNGANAGATIYSLIETSKANGINPYSYLKYILEKLPYCDTDEERKKLLPWNVDVNDIAKVAFKKLE